jgi:hypothetical protein
MQVKGLRTGVQVALRAATVLLAAASAIAIVPFLGRSAPLQAQLGGFGTFSGGCVPQFGGQIGGSGGCTFGTGFGGLNFGGLGGIGGTSQFGGQIGGFGAFLVAAPQATVAAGETLPLVFAWAVPEPETWRALAGLEVRVRDRGKVALWVRWDEFRNTLTLLDPRSGEPSGPRRELGSRGLLGGRLAAVELAGADAEDSGPDGGSVAILLPVRFGAAAAGRTFLLEVGADHDRGEVFFGTAGTIAVRSPG